MPLKMPLKRSPWSPTLKKYDPNRVFFVNTLGRNNTILAPEQESYSRKSSRVKYFKWLKSFSWAVTAISRIKLGNFSQYLEKNYKSAKKVSDTPREHLQLDKIYEALPTWNQNGQTCWYRNFSICMKIRNFTNLTYKLLRRKSSQRWHHQKIHRWKGTKVESLIKCTTVIKIFINNDINSQATASKQIK